MKSLLLRPPRCLIAALTLSLPVLSGLLNAEPISFGGLYRGDYVPDSRFAPDNTSIWSRGTSTLAIEANVDGLAPAPGIATFRDAAKDQRIQISLANNKRFGTDPASVEYSFLFRGKFHSGGFEMPNNLAVVAVGFRDEAGTQKLGKTVMLGFFDDIDPVNEGKQRGFGFVDERTQLVRELVRGNFNDGEFHTYEVEKYILNGKPFVRVKLDGQIVVNAFDYANLPDATTPQDGFGFYSSTVGTATVSVERLSFGTPVERKAEIEFDDPRDASRGSYIYRNGYADQPYVVKNADGSLTCVLTISDYGEGAASQRVVALRSSDFGRTWSAPVQLEPDGSPENSWALPFLTPYGRIYVFYTYNSTNLRSIKTEAGEDFTRVDSLGKLVYRYSDDGGLTWSPGRHEIPIRVSDFDRTNIYNGDVNSDGVVDENDEKFFWCVGMPVTDGSTMYFGMTKIRNFRLIGTFAETEGFVVCSPNIVSEREPSLIQWELRPEGSIGLRSRNGGVCEETTPIILSDGKLAAVCRTVEGHILSFYSSNKGRSWTSPEPLVYATGRRKLKNPRAKIGLWNIAAGRYLLWFHNNGETGFEKRNPAWVAAGWEENGKLVFSQPEILLFEREPTVRMSYPDLVVDGGRYLITETEKVVARSHMIDPQLIQGLFDQGKVKAVRKEGLAISLAGRVAGKAQVQHTVDLRRKGMTAEFWVRLKKAQGEIPLLSLLGDGGRGVRLVRNEAGAFELRIQTSAGMFSGSSDDQLATVGVWHHVVCIADPSPELVIWVVNGQLCDGGAIRALGFQRPGKDFWREFQSAKLIFGTKAIGSWGSVRVYDRPLRVSEAIANFHAGPDATF